MENNLSNIRVRDAKGPLYKVAKKKIRELVENGVFKPGSRLPRETELAEMLNVSRNTLREALRLAQMEGWIIQKHGVGTFVTQSGVVEEGLESLESIDALSKRQGWRCDTVDLCIETRPASDQLASALELEVGAPVVYVSRVKTADGKRIAYIEDYFPACVATIEELRSKFEGSVLDFFIAREQPRIDYAWADIRALHAGEMLSDKLAVPANTILFLIEETLFSGDGNPFEFSFNYLLMDFFKFHIIRTI